MKRLSKKERRCVNYELSMFRESKLYQFNFELTTFIIEITSLILMPNMIKKSLYK